MFSLSLHSTKFDCVQKIWENVSTSNKNHKSIQTHKLKRYLCFRKYVSSVSNSESESMSTTCKNKEFNRLFNRDENNILNVLKFSTIKIVLQCTGICTCDDRCLLAQSVRKHFRSFLKL